jgi:hypothetical protein
MSKAMTEAEFQCAYHDYLEPDEAKAKAEAETISIPGNKVIAVNFPGIGWALMLESAAIFLAPALPELDLQPKPREDFGEQLADMIKRML